MQRCLPLWVLAWEVLCYISAVRDTEKQMQSVDFKRTNVRLPRAVHTALKRASADRGLSIEQIVLLAVEKELGCFEATDLLRSLADRKMLKFVISELAGTTSLIARHLQESECKAKEPIGISAFASRFLEALPLSVAIKKASDHTFVWCNQACADQLGKSRSELVGKTLREILRLRPDHLSISRLSEIGTDQPHFAFEEYPIRGHNVPISVYRFSFELNSVDYIGDLSIPIEDLSNAQDGPVELSVPRIPDPLPVPNALLVAFLENLKTVAALKDPHARVVWCNEPFLGLAGLKTPQDAMQQTSAEIFGLPDGHPTSEYDYRVASEGIALLGPQRIGDALRLVAHFPIFGVENGNVDYIGVVSCEAKDVQLHGRSKRSRAHSKSV